MYQDTFQRAIEQIDHINAGDPNTEYYKGKEYPKELLYAQRMSDTLDSFEPKASNALKIAARAQHIARWKIERLTYSMDRVGYLRWREDLKKMHAQMTSEILDKIGYESKFIESVSDLIRKKMLKKNADAQCLEDVVCLVFLTYYFEDFAQKHSEEKLIEILQKTWTKMSKKGQASALDLPLDTRSKSLIQKALS